MIMTAQNNRLVGIVLAVTVILLIPLIAMQFTDSVNWSFLDFLIAGFLLLSSGFLSELVIRKVKVTRFRNLIVFAIILALLLIWAEMAVGIFGTPIAGN